MEQQANCARTIQEYKQISALGNLQKIVVPGVMPGDLCSVWCVVLTASTIWWARKMFGYFFNYTSRGWAETKWFRKLQCEWNALFLKTPKYDAPWCRTVALTAEPYGESRSNYTYKSSTMQQDKSHFGIYTRFYSGVTESPFLFPGLKSWISASAGSTSHTSSYDHMWFPRSGSYEKVVCPTTSIVGPAPANENGKKLPIRKWKEYINEEFYMISGVLRWAFEIFVFKRKDNLYHTQTSWYSIGS